MRRLLWIAGTVVGAVVLVVAVAAVAVPYLIDFDAYEHELAAAVRAHTGRELRFQGETRLSLLPRPGLDARQVVLSNPPDFPETAFARAERVEVRLRLLPLLLERRLLTHDVRIGGLRLSLTRNPAGVGNWTDLFPTRGEPDEGGGVPVGLLSGRIEVHDASAHFHDTAGSQYKVTNLHFQSGPVGATPSATELAFDIHGDALAGHLSARARVVRAAADVYRARRATVEAELGPPGAVRPARLVLATEAELDAATGVLVFKELQLEAPNVGVAGVRAETSARAGATLDLARGVLHVDGVDLSANLFGQRVPGGATELTARGALALDLSTDTWWARNIRLRLPALVGRGVAGNVSARAEAAGDLGRRTFSVNDLSVAAEFGGARVPGGALSLRADARLEGDMKERRLQVRALHVAGAGLDMRGALSVAGPWSDPRITDGTLRVAPFAPRIILERLTQRQILTPDPGALGEVALATGVSGSAAVLELSPLLLRVDHNTVRGSVTLLDRGDPSARFDLALQDVDLDRYLPVRVRGPEGPDEGPVASDAAAIPFVALRTLNVAGRLRIRTARLAGTVMEDVEISVDEPLSDKSGASALMGVLVGAPAPRAVAHPPRP